MTNEKPSPAPKEERIMVSDEKLISILKQYRYRAFGESRDENDNVAQELSDVVSAIEELLQSRATLANRAAVREPAKCDHMGCAVTTHTGATTGDCTRCGVTFVLPTLPGQRSVEPKTETCKTCGGKNQVWVSDRTAGYDPGGYFAPCLDCSPPVAPRPAAQEGWTTTRPKLFIEGVSDQGSPADAEALTALIRLHDTLNLADRRYYDDERIVLPYARQWMPALAYAIDALRATPSAPQVSPNSSSTSQEVREAAIGNGNTVAGFIGWLSADIPELRNVEVPRLAESYDRFLRRLATHPDGPT